MNKDEAQQLMKEMGVSEKDLTKEIESKPLHPALKLGLGTAFLLNVGLLLSLPPVLRGRGAPYLPTFQKNLNSMFEQIKKDKHFAQQQKQHQLTFVDLGSGDGRIVFRAAREKLFHRSIGYEINPLLHAYASLQRILRGPKVWSSTQFFIRDLWAVDLSNANVVAVYGLAPIMKDLGAKLEDELQPGSYVLSNVFTFPGWKPSASSADGTFIYRTPDCWQHGKPSGP